MNYENILSIDIGGTSIKIGVVNHTDILENTSIRNVFKGKSNQLIPGIKDVCMKYISKYNIKKIGIGCPGEIIDGVLMFASNLGWKNYKIKQDFENNFPSMEIKVENDGNAACLAEIKYGSLKNINNGLFVTFGRGVGGSIIVENKILRGVNNRGGKFGHMIIHTNGRKCNCGRKGCFETYTSVLGLIQNVKEINHRWPNENEKLDVTSLSGFKIVEAVKKQNPIALEAIKKWNKDIAEGFLNLCLIFDPLIIVMAGGITDSGLIDIDFIKSFLSQNDYPNCQVKLATFTGKTGLIGASCLFL